MHVLLVLRRIGHDRNVVGVVALEGAGVVDLGVGRDLLLGDASVLDVVGDLVVVGEQPTPIGQRQQKGGEKEYIFFILTY